jgi:serralysin
MWNFWHSLEMNGETAMSQTQQFDWQLNRRQMLQLGGAACACGILGKTAMAGDPNDPLTKKLSAKQTFFCTSIAPITHQDHQAAAARIKAMRPDMYNKLVGKGFRIGKAPAAVPVGGTRASMNRVERLAISTSLLWEKKSRITYRFIDPNPDSELSARIEAAFKEWAPHTGLAIEPVAVGTADIRVTFLDVGYWSAIGTQARQFDSNGPTLSIQPGNPNEYPRATLHETGHALGAIHEHQAPTTHIPWDRFALYAYYKANFGWDQQTVDEQVINLYDDGPVSNTVFDPKSIMNYVIPDEVLLPGATASQFEVPQFNNALSDTDRRFMEVVYGVRAPSPDDNKSSVSPTAVVTDRQKLKVADAKALPMEAVVSGEFPSDPQMQLYKVDGVAGNYVLETVDGALLQDDGTFLGGILGTAVPVVLELFDGTDFSEDKIVKDGVSRFGATGTGLLDSSLGVQDAFLKCKLVQGTTYYVLVRPQQRLATGSKGTYSLWLRKEVSDRSKAGLKGSSWSDLKGQIVEGQTGIRNAQDDTQKLLKVLRK